MDEYPEERVSERTESFDGSICRLVSLRHLPSTNGSAIRCEAVIIKEHCSWTAHWEAEAIVPYRPGCLYRIEWAGWPLDADGSLTIGNLHPLEGPGPDINPFHSIPEGWLRDRPLGLRASVIWSMLPPGFRHLLTAVLWDPVRFENYVRGPSSRGHHHNQPNGNFRHSVEVAEQAGDFADRSPTADREILVAAALLHDVAKAEEYRFHHDRSHAGWSEEGSLLGHKLMAYGWVVESVTRYGIDLPARQFLALRHLLIATPGVPDWTGLPRPRMLECEMLSAADRISSRVDLFAQLAPENGGFGMRHESMKLLPFFSVSQRSNRQQSQES